MAQTYGKVLASNKFIKKPRLYVRNQDDDTILVLNGDEYFDATLDTFVKGSAAILTFSIVKKDTDYAIFTGGKNVSFIYRGNHYWLSINNIEQDEYIMTIEAWSLGLEFNSEQVGPLYCPADSGFDFLYYFNLVVTDDTVKIGKNELGSSKKVVIEIPSPVSKLEALFTYADAFEAELEFVTTINSDGSLKSIILNVYKAHTDSIQGIGTDKRYDKLYFGKDIKIIQKNEDASNIITAVYVRGSYRDENKKEDVEVNLFNYNKVINDDSGAPLYSTHNYSISGRERAYVYAEQAVKQFPSINNVYANDKWTLYSDIDTGLTTTDALFNYAVEILKARSVPQITWKIEGVFDLEVGDTVRIVDEGYNPTLFLDARVLQYTLDFDSPENSKLVFSNVKELQSNISQSLLNQVNKLINENKSYVFNFSSTNGTSFANGRGSTVLKAIVREGATNITNKCTITWFFDDDITSSGSGDSYQVLGADVEDVSVIRYEVKLGNEYIGGMDITVSSIKDGAPGYLHLAYANSFDGQTDFSTTDSVDKSYLGTYSDNILTGSQNPGDYKWVKFAGQSSYMHIAYANSEDGKVDFSTVSSKSRAFIGTYSDAKPSGSQDYKDYKWSLIKGDDGLKAYVHTAYASTRDGGGFTLQPTLDSLYIGTYSDNNEEQSTVVNKYTWVRFVGKDGENGTPGANGSSTYFHIAYANSSDGILGFTTTEGLGRKYLGTYTDFVKADSTDPKKYRWVELAGAIEVGAKNLLNETKNTLAINGTALPNHIETPWPFEKKGLANLSLEKGDFVTISFTWQTNSTTGTIIPYLNASPYTMATLINAVGTDSYDSDILTLTGTKKQGGVILTYKLGADIPLSKATTMGIKADGIESNVLLTISNFQFERGNVSTNWGMSDEDFSNDLSEAWKEIGNKVSEEEAEEIRQIAEDIKNSFESFVSSGGEYETDLANLDARTIGLYQELGEKVAQLQFVNTYLRVGEEGLTIGSNDSSLKLLLTNTGLSFIDSGKTVAYFSNQNFYINSGAVVESLIVGNHKFSAIGTTHTTVSYMEGGIIS